MASFNVWELFVFLFGPIFLRLNASSSIAHLLLKGAECSLCTATLAHIEAIPAPRLTAHEEVIFVFLTEWTHFYFDAVGYFSPVPALTDDVLQTFATTKPLGDVH